MKLNKTKCKFTIISYELKHPKLDPVFIEEHELVLASSASKRLYFLHLLIRAGIDRATRALRIIHTDLSYRGSLQATPLSSLSQKRHNFLHKRSVTGISLQNYCGIKDKEKKTFQDGKYGDYISFCR